MRGFYELRSLIRNLSFLCIVRSRKSTFCFIFHCNVKLFVGDVHQPCVNVSFAVVAHDQKSSALLAVAVERHEKRPWGGGQTKL